VDLQTGIIAGIGGMALGLPRIVFRRIKPVSGSWCILVYPRLIDEDSYYLHPLAKQNNAYTVAARLYTVTAR
jgi:hypothetical protein